MSTYAVQKSFLDGVVRAIQDKTGSTDKLLIDEIIPAITNIMGDDEHLLVDIKNAYTTSRKGTLIDTGVHLSELDTWTFVVKYKYNGSTISQSVPVLHGMYETSGYPGLTLDTRAINGVLILCGVTLTNIYTHSAIDGADCKILVKYNRVNNSATVFTDKYPDGYTFKTRNALNPTDHPDVTLMVGGFKDINGTYGRNAPISDVYLKFWDVEKTDDECKSIYNNF